MWQMQRATWALMRQAEPGDDARPATRDSVRNIRKAITLYTTGIWPSIAYGLEQYGPSPTDFETVSETQQLHVRVLVDISLAVSLPSRLVWDTNITLVFKHVSAFSPGGSAFWDESRELHQLIRKAWQRVHSTLRFSKCRWRLVRGSMSSVVATLMDMGADSARN